jgi:hypothetical protein
MRKFGRVHVTFFDACFAVVVIGTGKKSTAFVDGLWYKEHVGLNGYARISEAHEI